MSRSFARREGDDLAIYGPMGRAAIPGAFSPDEVVAAVTAALQPAECEGYSNYPTFAVAVVLRNERETVKRWRIQARNARTAADASPAAGFTTDELAAVDLARWLKDAHERGAADLDGAYSSLLGYGLSCVDWHEIAVELLDDVTGEG